MTHTPTVAPLRNQRANHAGAVSSGRWRAHLGTGLIVLAALIAAVPLWVHGPAGADDFEFHLVSWLDAQASWRHGIVYPHWATSPNFGAGEPRFVFYPPLSWMAGAALGTVLPWALVPVALTFLMLAGTGLATRKLAREMLPEPAALLAGCAVIYSGYALFTAYFRQAYGEMCGGFLIPLLLLFALRDEAPGAEGWRRALEGSAARLTLVVAGCWMCDAPLGVMASYLLAGVALAAAVTRRRWFPLLRATVAMVLGLGLAAVYLVPAAWEQRWVDIAQATGVNGDPGLRIENNWLFPHHTDPALHGRDVALHFVSPLVLSMVVVAVECALLVWGLRKLRPVRSRLQRGWWVPLALIAPVVLFLQLPVSLPVWNAIPKLRFLQFPWRWLVVVEAPMAIFFAAAVWPDGARQRWLKAAVVCVSLLLFAGALGFATGNFFRDDTEMSELSELLGDSRAVAGVVGTEEYAPPGGDNSLVPIGLPDGCVADDFDTELGVATTQDENPKWSAVQGSCMATAQARARLPESLRMTVFAPRDGFLILKLRSYPAWRIVTNGQPLRSLPQRDDGLIAIPVAAGPVSVAVDWTTTPDVVVGRCLSILAVLGLVGLVRLERGVGRRRLR